MSIKVSLHGIPSLRSKGRILEVSQGFTLVELIVVITILAILGTIAFIALQGYSSQSRDSVRISDISKMKTGLELFHIDSGKYPDPTELQPVTYKNGLAWNQGIFGENTYTNVDRVSKIPKDPLLDIEYTYSLLNTKQEYEIGTMIETEEIGYRGLIREEGILYKLNAEEKIGKAMISGTYNGISLRVNVEGNIYILAVPSIITSIDLDEEGNRDLEKIITMKELVLNYYRNLPSNYKRTNYKTNPETTNEEYEIVKGNSTGSLLLYSSGTLEGFETEEFIRKIIEAYSGTTVEELEKANQFLSIDLTNEEELERADIIGVTFINKYLGGSAESRIYATCNGISHNTTKSYYTQESVTFTEGTCDNIKQDFVCKDGVWKNGETVLDTNVYAYESCTELGALNCEANASYNSGTTQTYNVTALNHNDTETFTTDINENNGIFRYSIDVNCYNGVLTNSEEVGPTNISCDTGYIWDGNSCELDTQWSGDATSGFIFSSAYPTSCNNLLSNTDFQVGTTSPWNGSKFVDGVYWIKPDSNEAFKVYCDMTTDGGGWIRIKKENSNYMESFVNLSNLQTTYIHDTSYSENYLGCFGYNKIPGPSGGTASMTINTKINFTEIKSSNYIRLSNSNHSGYLKFGSQIIHSGGSEYQINYLSVSPTSIIYMYLYNSSWTGGYGCFLCGEIFIR